MPRNSQVTRQLLLLQKLEGSKGATLEELVEYVGAESRPHSRTVRRDLEALEAVFPLVVERRDGKTVWRLMDGYPRALRLTFSQTELMALVFSKDLLRPLDGTELKASLDSAFQKMAAALPAEGASFLGSLRDFFSVGLGPHKKYREHRDTIETLTRAISRSRTVQMRYFSASRNATGRRNVDPYRLWYAQGALYLIGYCHLREDVRLFAVERIRALTVTSEPCQMPLGFDVDEYVANALLVMRGKPIEVRLRFARSAVPWVRDREWHPSQRLEAGPKGSLLMTLRVADTPELVGWILSFGSRVKVLAPEEVKGRVREEAKKIFGEP